VDTAFIDIPWRSRRVRIEHAFIEGPASAPLLVFLHEGLGSLSMWRDFPQRLCEAIACPGLVYSRPGYGQSTPREPQEHWGVDFLHQQALEVLPSLLHALGIDAQRAPPWLFGHSDGGSIALLYAARFPKAVAGVVVLAPHLFVEPLSLRSIQVAKVAYLEGGLRDRLARHHADPDSAFWGWNDIWLDPAFEAWNIEPELSAIRCPVLAVQGLDDEYGTLDQIHRLQRAAPHAQLLELLACGHQPQRDQPEKLRAAVADFMRYRRRGSLWSTPPA
jgi:pimeloyl-ACP methyl ester carboxylesterase